MMNRYNCFGLAYGNWFDWAIGLVIVIIIIGLVVKIINQKNKLNNSSKASPLDILKNRYAKGEISKTEFEEKKKGLE